LPTYSAAVIIWIVIFNPLNFAINSQQSKLEEILILLLLS